MNEIRTNYPDAQCSKCDQWAGRTSGHFWKKAEQKIIKIY
jgi:hypothetical protein